jgi:nucleoside-diphosphate-sugar epimerase
MTPGDTCLVTGVSGYLASWLAHFLIERGYRVRGTVRQSLDARKRETLRTLLPGLELAEADLNDSAGWDEAMRDCRWIFHVASPLPASGSSDHVAVALEGTRKVLGAAFRATSSEKIVLTSSEAAICFGHPRSKRRFTEKDWTPLDGVAGANPYFASKTVAERLAWEMINDPALNPRGIPMAAINPSFIAGPSLVPWGRFSLTSLRELAEGRMKIVPDMPTRFVDVRDCARMHIALMQAPETNGGRHFCFAMLGGWKEAADVIHRHFADRGLSPKPWVAGYWTMRLLGLFSNDAASVAGRTGCTSEYVSEGRHGYEYAFRDFDALIRSSLLSALE